MLAKLARIPRSSSQGTPSHKVQSAVTQDRALVLVLVPREPAVDGPVRERDG